MKQVQIMAVITVLAISTLTVNARQNKTRKKQDTIQKYGRDTINHRNNTTPRHVRIDTTSYPYDSIPHKTIKGR